MPSQLRLSAKVLLGVVASERGLKPHPFVGRHIDRKTIKKVLFLSNDVLLRGGRRRHSFKAGLPQANLVIALALVKLSRQIIVCVWVISSRLLV